MAYGKNPKLSKGRKGQKKKIVDPFTRKDWYDIKAPTVFVNTQVGKTLVTRTTGTKVASDGLKGRIIEVNLADLNDNESHGYRNIKLKIQDVQGRNCMTDFYGMSLTTDKLCSLISKWQSLIEANIEAKTTDGYTLRLFCIAFTEKRPNQVRKTSYAKTSQVKAIRRKMLDIMAEEVSNCSLKELVAKFVPNSIARRIKSESVGIYPLKDVYIRKVKLLKAPKFDLYKLMEWHAVENVAVAKKNAAVSGDADKGVKVEA